MGLVMSGSRFVCSELGAMSESESGTGMEMSSFEESNSEGEGLSSSVDGWIAIGIADS